MLDQCANPKCAKPLRYLREGRIFVFDALPAGSDGSRRQVHRLEHYWLCGSCSETLFPEKTRTGIRLQVKVGSKAAFVHSGEAQAS
jgi:hypothetical protein